MKQIICSDCKALVEVKDRQVVEHEKDGEPCPGSGAHYSSAGGARRWIGPGVELLDAQPCKMACCGRLGAQLTLRVYPDAVRRAMGASRN